MKKNTHTEKPTYIKHADKQHVGQTHTQINKYPN